jgi:hypothetical protein
MLRFTKSRSDRLRFISSLDEAVDTSTPEGVEGYQKYLEDLNEGHLTLVGQPTVFIFRPLTHEVIGIAAQHSRGIVIPGTYLSPQANLELFRLSCESMEPGPEDWEEGEVYRFEFRRQVLSYEVMGNLADGLLREGVKVLIDSLPEMEAQASGDETDPFGQTESEDSSGSSSAGTSGSGSSRKAAKSARRRKGAKKPTT